jgi:hypothetical protein
VTYAGDVSFVSLLVSLLAVVGVGHLPLSAQVIRVLQGLIVLLEGAVVAGSYLYLD